MTTIKLHNTKTRQKEVFEPLDPKNVRMYVCGPTVYDRAHLGNARPALVFDVLFRLLRYVYGEKHVTYARNITDVDDKINAEAQRRKAAGAAGRLEELIKERADETTAWYQEDMRALGNLDPSAQPRATEYIDQMIALAQRLIDRDHAYVAEGHVLFRVRSYKDYGALSGRSVDDMIAGARVEVAPFKEDPMDFVLWKPSDADLPGWDSPWGRGRPGWHIECSAMAADILGERFDIHGGGNDLQFPHHENEIAQSKCAGHDFAQVWLHNEMLQVEGKKMSKSLGNFFTVRDLLDQGVPGEVIRFVMLSTHYRKPMDWTEKKRDEATKRLTGWKRLLRHGLSGNPSEFTHPDLVDEKIVAALSDDLNTHGALKRLFDLEIEARTAEIDSIEVKTLATNLKFVGFGSLEMKDARLAKVVGAALDHTAEFQKLGSKMRDLRESAKLAKDFGEADKFRDRLLAVGLEVQVNGADVKVYPTDDFDPIKLEDLL